jgi:DNA-binding NtrC family response regulator
MKSAISPELQANLLRFLEEKKIRRLGSTKPIPVQCPMIAATNTHLEQAVRDGRFREDLYYRLNVLHLRAPSLRERKGDVELLAKHFFTKFAAETKTSAKGFSRDALEVINRYDWPGNVRELMNRVRRAVLLSEGPYITPRRSGTGTALAGAGLRDPGRGADGGRSRNDPGDLAAHPLQYRPRRPGTGRFAHDAVPSDGEIRYSAG